MHDPTDGGLLEGLYEFAEAANLDFIVYEDRIKIAKSTLKLARIFNIDPLKLISSGVLLAAIPPSKIDLALNTLKNMGIEASIIGFFKVIPIYLTDISMFIIFDIDFICLECQR